MPAPDIPILNVQDGQNLPRGEGPKHQELSNLSGPLMVSSSGSKSIRAHASHVSHGSASCHHYTYHNPWYQEHLPPNHARGGDTFASDISVSAIEPDIGLFCRHSRFTRDLLFPDTLFLSMISAAILRRGLFFCFLKFADFQGGNLKEEKKNLCLLHGTK